MHRSRTTTNHFVFRPWYVKAARASAWFWFQSCFFFRLIQCSTSPVSPSLRKNGFIIHYILHIEGKKAALVVRCTAQLYRSKFLRWSRLSVRMQYCQHFLYIVLNVFVLTAWHLVNHGYLTVTCFKGCLLTYHLPWMPFYRDYYKGTIILGKTLHSLLVWLRKQMPKSFHLFQLFSQTKRELAIHGWIRR